MNNCYEILILGSTFAGLGAAYACRSNMLVLDRRTQIGYEFINSFDPGEHWNRIDLSSEGEKLKKELLDRDILSENGLIHLPAAAPLMYHRISRDEVPILLMTEVINIQQKSGVFEVEIFNVSGSHSFRALRILDTVFDTRLQSVYRPEVISKSINAMLYNVESEDQMPSGWSKEVRFFRGKLPGEVILKLRLDEKDDWISARCKLHQLWENRPDFLKRWTIAAVADCFEQTVQKGPMDVTENWSILPSAAYRNPLEAFEAGYRYINKEEEAHEAGICKG